MSKNKTVNNIVLKKIVAVLKRPRVFGLTFWFGGLGKKNTKSKPGFLVYSPTLVQTKGSKQSLTQAPALKHRSPVLIHVEGDVLIAFVNLETCLTRGNVLKERKCGRPKCKGWWVEMEFARFEHFFTQLSGMNLR